MLMDRVRPRMLLSASQVLQAATLILAAVVAGPAPILVYGLLLGTTQGLNGAIQASVHAHYFGRKHLGAIKGLASAVSVAGDPVGPLGGALGCDAAGSYTPVLRAG